MGFDWSILWQYREPLISGAITTFSVVLVSLFFGALIASVVCAGSLQKRRFLRAPARVYVQIFRVIPEVALIFWVYLCLPLVLDIRMTAFESGALAISLICGAYLAEILRAGIIAVPKGQSEAAVALGLSALPRWYKVILPQALRIVLPNIVSFLTELVKMTSLLAAISVGEMAYQANVLGSLTFKYNEFFTSVAIAYFVVIFPITVLSRRLEKKGA